MIRVFLSGFYQPFDAKKKGKYCDYTNKTNTYIIPITIRSGTMGYAFQYFWLIAFACRACYDYKASTYKKESGKD